MKTRRDFLKKSAIAGLGVAGLAAACSPKKTKSEVKANIRPNPIGVSSYSFWQFDGPKEERSMKDAYEKPVLVKHEPLRDVTAGDTPGIPA